MSGSYQRFSLNLPAPRRTSFRSIHAALASCRDGDIIVLQPGIHNGLGMAAVVTKRVVIVGGDASALTHPLTRLPPP